MPFSRGSFFRDQTHISCSSWIAGRFFTAEPTGKPTGYIILKSEREVTQSCLTLSDPMDCSLPGSSVHEIFQARVLEWAAIAFSSGLHDGM